MRINVSEIIEREEPVVQMELLPDEISLVLPEETGRVAAVCHPVLSFSKEPSGVECGGKHYQAAYGKDLPFVEH